MKVYSNIFFLPNIIVIHDSLFELKVNLELRITLDPECATFSGSKRSHIYCLPISPHSIDFRMSVTKSKLNDLVFN